MSRTKRFSIIPSDGVDGWKYYMRPDVSRNMNPINAHEEFSSLEPMFASKRFDIPPPDWVDAQKVYKEMPSYFALSPLANFISEYPRIPPQVLCNSTDEIYVRLYVEYEYTNTLPAWQVTLVADLMLSVCNS